MQKHVLYLSSSDNITFSFCTRCDEGVDGECLAKSVEDRIGKDEYGVNLFNSFVPARNESYTHRNFNISISKI